MNNKYRILIIGNIYDNHLVRFVKFLKLANREVHIECVSLFQNRSIPKEIKDYISEVYLVPDAIDRFKLPFLRTFLFILWYVFYFHKFTKGKKFDIVNIHFPIYYHYFILPLIKRVTSNLVLTPWGSDVYRIGKVKRRILRGLYQKASYITGQHGRFILDVQQIYHLSSSNIVHLGIGSEMIDYITQNKKIINKEDAQNKLGFGNRYIITIGYNAATAQRHLAVLDSLYKIKSLLPSNLLLLFPCTYPKNSEYINQIKLKVKQYGFEAIFFEEYMNVESLFIIRQATDMFIHVQTTDANSASLKEYVLLNKIIINGGWLYYEDLVKNGDKPYFEVNSLEELPSVITTALQKKDFTNNSQLLEYISSLGCIPWAQKWDQFFSSISKF